VIDADAKSCFGTKRRNALCKKGGGAFNAHSPRKNEQVENRWNYAYLQASAEKNLDSQRHEKMQIICDSAD
jgi:hypothetical protein